MAWAKVLVSLDPAASADTQAEPALPDRSHFEAALAENIAHDG